MSNVIFLLPPLGNESGFRLELLTRFTFFFLRYRHLIADHLGWFKTTDGTSDGSLKTIEDIMRSKGEKVSRGRLDHDGVVEFSE